MKTLMNSLNARSEKVRLEAAQDIMDRTGHRIDLSKKEIELNGSIQFIDDLGSFEDVQKKTISDFIPMYFHNLMRAANTKGILNIVAKGGRGSGKSTDVAIIFAYMIMKYAVNGVIVRKTDNTLATSVFEQIKEAINMLGVGHLFKAKVNPSIEKLIL